MADPRAQDFRGKYENPNPIARKLVDGFFSSLEGLTTGLELNSVHEAGCGEGFSTSRIRDILPLSASFTASDLEESNLHHARLRNPNIDFSREDATALNFEDESFDLVYLLEVMEHLHEPERALREVLRVSRRYVILSVPREPLWRCLNMARGKYWSDLGNTPGHLQNWSSTQFTRFVSQHAKVLRSEKPIPWTMLLVEKLPRGRSRL